MWFAGLSLARTGLYNDSDLSCLSKYNKELKRREDCERHFPRARSTAGSDDEQTYSEISKLPNSDHNDLQQGRIAIFFQRAHRAVV
jgi:hypothetical protein